MGYDHTTVARAELVGAELLESQTKAINGMDADELAEAKDNLSMVDGMYTLNSVALFVGELRKVDRNLQFAPSAVSRFRDSRLRAVTGLYVYYKGDRYAMAEIKYGQVGVTETENDRFAVFSRKVCNEKFSSSRDQYYRAASVDLSKAVKNFKRYAIPYAPYEIAQMSLTRAASASYAAKVRPQRAMRDLTRELFEESSFWADTLRLYDSGHRFSSPKVNELFQKMSEAKREGMERSGRAVHMCAVEARDDGRFSLTKVLDMDDNTPYKSLPATSPHVVTQEQLPEAMQHKLALLSMVDDGAYVDEVGIRVNDWMYWIHIDGNEFTV